MRAPIARGAALPPLPLDTRELERVRIRAHRRARTGGTGAHLRRQAGQSQEFREYRRYVAGDDIRFVDWRATLRLGARGPADWVVKTFHAEEALTVVLAVDLRPSMMLPEAVPKLLPALWTVQAIGRMLGRSGDEIVVLPLAGPADLMDRAAGRHARAVADRFAERCWRERDRPDWEATPPLNARLLLDLLPPAALIVVVSDLYLSDEDTDALSGLLHRCQQSYREVVVIVPESWPYEEALLRRGPVKMRSLEGVAFPDRSVAFAPEALTETGRSIAAHRRQCLERAQAGGLSPEPWIYPSDVRLDGRGLAEAFRGWFHGAQRLFDALGGGAVTPLAAFAAATVAAAAVWLVILYLRRPPFEDFRPSAARFLSRFAATSPPPRRFDPRVPVRRWRFWLRLSALGLMALALVDGLVPGLRAGDRRLGLLVVVDTSYSMTTESGTGTRADAARDLLDRAAQQLGRASDAAAVCSRVLLVDDQVRDGGVLDAGGVDLQPRPRGGTAAALNAAAGLEAEPCLTTQVLVITDLPRSSALPAPRDGRRVSWLTVGAAMPNAGLVEARMIGGGLSDRRRVVVTILADGGGPPPDVSVGGPGGRDLPVVRLDDGGDPHVQRISFEPAERGLHQVRLRDGGAYRGDDRLLIDVPLAAALTVNWRSAAPYPTLAGWQRVDDGSATLSVGPADEAAVQAPLSLRTYRRLVPVTAPAIGYFDEDHPILRGVSLDVFEAAAPVPLDALPDGFAPVLTDPAGHPWVAVALVPRAVIVPEFEAPADEDRANLSATLFYNALDWLLADWQPRIAATWLTPDGEPISGAAGEATPGAAGAEPPDLPALHPVSSAAPREPVWPLAALAAALLTLVDRGVSVPWRRPA